MVKGYSAVSFHYWREQDASLLSNVMTKRGPSVQLPNNTTIAATKQGQLPLSKHISSTGSSAMVLSGLKISSLVSLGQLCNDGCIIGLDSTELVVVKNSNIVLKGTRNLKDGLWDIPLYKSTIQSFNHPTPKTHAGMYMARHVVPTTARTMRTPSRNNQSR